MILANTTIKVDREHYCLPFFCLCLYKKKVSREPKARDMEGKVSGTNNVVLINIHFYAQNVATVVNSTIFGGYNMCFFFMLMASGSSDDTECGGHHQTGKVSAMWSNWEVCMRMED